MPAAVREVTAFLATLATSAAGPAAADDRLHEDLGLDSLQRLEVLAWLAQRGVTVGAARGAELRTVAEVAELLGTGGAAVPAPGGAPAREQGRPDPGGQPRAVTLTAGGFALRPMTPEHLPFLYALATSEQTGFRWRFRGAVPSQEAFQAALTQGVQTQFVVVFQETGEPAGEVVAYNVDHPNGTAYAAAVFRPDLMRTGLPVDAFLLFLRYLFQVWNFRKVYLEMPSYNFELIASGAGRWFEIEGRLRDFTYYAGAFWDEYILAIGRHHVEALSDASFVGAAPGPTGPRL